MSIIKYDYQRNLCQPKSKVRAFQIVKMYSRIQFLRFIAFIVKIFKDFIDNLDFTYNFKIIYFMGLRMEIKAI